MIDIKELFSEIATQDNQYEEKFKTYYRELIDYNQKVNLTAITDEEEVYIKHFFNKNGLFYPGNILKCNHTGFYLVLYGYINNKSEIKGDDTHEHFTIAESKI